MQNSWELRTKLDRLEKKFSDALTQMNDTQTRDRQSMLNLVSHLKADILSDVSTQLTTLETQKDEFLDVVSATVTDVRQQKQDIQTLYSDLKQKIANMQFDIIENDNNVSITYVNHDGQTEYVSIPRLVVDQKDFSYKNETLRFKLNFDSNTLRRSNDVLTTVGLQLTSGRYLTADRINNDLTNATNNIKSLTSKLESISKQLSTVNGYISSNNFRTDEPKPESLTTYALSCIYGSNKDVTINDIPSGTKIKNTYDDHIWVLNRVNANGLVTSKWEDFGSDTICVASNNGVYGLVTGSQERLRGYIDINGVISINGLEEELNSLLKVVSDIQVSVSEYQSRIDAKLYDLEQQVEVLKKELE